MGSQDPINLEDGTDPVLLEGGGDLLLEGSAGAFIVVNPRGHTFLFPDSSGNAQSPLRLQVPQGLDYNAVFQLDVLYGSFVQGSTPGATLWNSPSGASLASPTVAWWTAGNTQTGYTQAQVQLTIPGAQTSGLDPGGEYLLNIAATTGGSTILIAQSRVDILPSPGNAGPVVPDLVSADYCRGLLSISLDLTPAQVDAIPALVTAASDAIRSWCNRRFDQGLVTEELEVSLYGEILLSRPPINWVQRIQYRPAPALYPSNGTADAAWVYAAITGDVASGETVTGLVLNWEVSGAANSSTVLFSTLADQRISTLASAISAVGSGWTATANPAYGDLPLSELFDLANGKGVGPNDQPWQGAYHLYSQNLTRYRPHPDRGRHTGTYQVGRIADSSLAERWGPGGDELFGDPGGSASDWGGRVKATYNGGFATVPREIQLACTELVKSQLSRLGTDLLLRTEHAGDYSYAINEDQILALPRQILTAITRYRLTDA